MGAGCEEPGHNDTTEKSRLTIMGKRLRKGRRRHVLSRGIYDFRCGRYFCRNRHCEFLSCAGLNIQTKRDADTLMHVPTSARRT